MRFRVRQLQQNIVDYVIAELDRLGWVGTTINYGTTPVTVMEDVDLEDPPADLAPNTVAVTIPDEGPDEVAELGGGLYRAIYSLFIDCYGESGTMAQRILGDLKDSFTDRELVLRDYAGSTPVRTDERCEFDIIAIERPGRSTSGVRAMEARRRWRVMTLDATVYFQPQPLIGTILLESGASLHTEDGDPILLEDS